MHLGFRLGGRSRLFELGSHASERRRAQRGESRQQQSRVSPPRTLDVVIYDNRGVRHQQPSGVSSSSTTTIETSVDDNRELRRQQSSVSPRRKIMTAARVPSRFPPLPSRFSVRSAKLQHIPSRFFRFHLGFSQKRHAAEKRGDANRTTAKLH